MRRWRRIAALLLALLSCLLPHLLWKLGGCHSPWPRRFLMLAARAVGVRVQILGTPLRRDVFFVANHLSWIDILALGGATGAAFISKDDVADWPLVGWLARQNNTLFVARHRRNGVGKQVDAVRTAMAGHQPIALFPEGTTGDGHALLPFKASLFAVMMPPPRDLLVQPVCMDYGAAAPGIAWTDRESTGANALRVLGRPEKLAVRLHFLAPFDPEDFPDRKAIAAEARKRIEACLAPSAPPSRPV